MCGIYGMFKPRESLNRGERVWAEKACMHLLEHRGPDGCTQVERLNGRCLLGHVRLAIIDIEGGAQPLTNEDGTVWVICNGEIYNYVELREGLIARGHTFRTQSDCEVLAHLYEDKGDAVVEDLVGVCMPSRSSMKSGNGSFSSRDRCGEKPMYWAELPNGKHRIRLRT